jgi:hypothetical protein
MLSRTSAGIAMKRALAFTVFASVAVPVELVNNRV